VIAAPIDDLWAILRRFNGHAIWHPAVTTSMMEAGGASDQVGAVRAIRLKDGSRFCEQLLFLSDSKRTLGYCLLEAPVSQRNYVAVIRLRPVTAENACFWEWRASFDSPPSERQRLTRFICDDIIEVGFAAMHEFL
jgi:hypothetical protein